MTHFFPRKQPSVQLLSWTSAVYTMLLAIRGWTLNTDRVTASNFTMQKISSKYVCNPGPISKSLRTVN